MQGNVKLAALMLDREIPGWEDMVDIHDFQMFSCHKCVLGHVFGPKMEARLAAILGDKTPSTDAYAEPFSRGSAYLRARIGYQFDHPLFGAFGASECDWIKEIAERRARKECEQEASVRS